MPEARAAVKKSKSSSLVRRSGFATGSGPLGFGIFNASGFRGFGYNQAGAGFARLQDRFTKGLSVCLGLDSRWLFVCQVYTGFRECCG